MASELLCNIVTPVGMLGYGFNEKETQNVLVTLATKEAPVAIILDSGSTDSGPEKLALGTMSTPRTSYVRDLEKLLKLVHLYRVPLIFSSAGGDGADEHVKELLGIVEEITAKHDEYRFKTIGIFAGIDKTLVRERLKAGAITGCGKCVPPLREEEIDRSARVVAQMGPEPFVDAMVETPDFDIIVGGRAYDPAPYVAYAAYLAEASLDNITSEKVQRQIGGFTHMGKIMECGGICATPKSHGAIAKVYSNGEFEISPLRPTARCTPLSVAAHTMYEKTRPDILHGPGGYLDLNHATYEQLPDGRSVKVRGSMFHFTKAQALPYQVKLEAAKVIGFRTMFMGSIRDPIMIKRLDPTLELIKKYVTSQHPNVPLDQWEIGFHRYGLGWGCTDAQDTSAAPPPEVFLVCETVATSQELATSLATMARIGLIHTPYAGQKATAGNLAFGLGGKLIMELGPCAKFSIYHLMNLEDEEEHLFVEGGQAAPTANGNSGHKVHKQLFTQTISVFGKGEGRLEDNQIPAPVSSDDAKSSAEEEYQRVALAATKTPPDSVPQDPRTVGDLASVIRSKNSGPYEITFDLMFKDRDTYEKVKEANFLNKEAVAAAFDLAEENIIWIGFFDPAQAFKATIARIRLGEREPAGGFMEDDVHGSQRHIPLVNMPLPENLLASLRANEPLSQAQLDLATRRLGQASVS
ncbi:hypothetical protein F5B20DRAFT_252956 [Whalleya microplaca]|nr:hypothetical protein F5B20DRAFT_252956 [Whalleya microplaca]